MRDAQGNTTDEGAGIQVFHTAAFGAVDILPADATGLPVWVAGLMSLGALGLAVPAAATACPRR